MVEFGLWTLSVSALVVILEPDRNLRIFTPADHCRRLSLDSASKRGDAAKAHSHDAIARVQGPTQRWP